jgi:HEXXH motif-containing protein
MAAQYSKHLLLVWAVKDAARRTRHPQASHACRGYDLLADVQRRAPGAVEAVLRHPSVGAWASRALRTLLSAEQLSAEQLSAEQPAGTGRPGIGRAGGEPAQLAALAAAAAIRARYPCAIEVPASRGVVTLPSIGQAVLSPASLRDGPMANVRYTAEGTRVIAGRRLVLVPADTRADSPGWRGLRALRATTRGMTLRLVIDDLDPDRMPGRADLGGRLSPAEAMRWQRVLPPAWDLLADQPGTTAEEIQAAIQVLTPLRRPAHGQVSASSPDAFGGVALSPPAGALALAVTLAQEIQHAKLGALADLVMLTEPDDGQRYDAPWCDHPRCADAWCEDARRDGGRCDGAKPAGALLQRAYGCLGVSGFWRWQRLAEDRAAAARARLEFTRWRDAAAAATRVVRASDRLTDAGRTFVAGMAVTLQAWADEKTPVAALSQTRAGRELPRNQLTVDGPGARMSEETALLADDEVLDHVLRSGVPDVTGLSLRDLDDSGQSGLAGAARRIAGAGGDGW